MGELKGECLKVGFDSSLRLDTTDEMTNFTLKPIKNLSIQAVKSERFCSESGKMALVSCFNFDMGNIDLTLWVGLENRFQSLYVECGLRSSSVLNRGSAGFRNQVDGLLSHRKELYADPITHRDEKIALIQPDDVSRVMGGLRLAALASYRARNRSSAFYAGQSNYCWACPEESE